MTQQSSDLIQEVMIRRLRALCQRDERVDSGFLYGSFTRDEGDQFSDIEAILYFADDILPQIDRRAWGDQIAPVAHTFVNEHGIQTFIFENLVRGEIHFDPVSMIESLPIRAAVVRFPTLQSALILDRNDHLAPVLAQLVGPPIHQDTAQGINRLLNATLDWGLFGVSVWARGEYARSMEILHILHRQILQLARIHEGQTANWLTPSKNLEDDLSPASYSRFVMCTASLEPKALGLAYGASLAWAEDLLPALCAQHNLDYPSALMGRIRGMLSVHTLD